MEAISSFFSAYWLEFFLLVVLFYYAFDGYIRGFVLVSLETLGFIAALVGSLLGYRLLAKLLVAVFKMPDFFSAAVAFLILWALIDLVWPPIVRRWYRRVPETWKAKKWNRWAGIAPGILNGGLLFAVLLSVLLALPVPGVIKERVSDSVVARPMLAVASSLDRLFKPILGPLGDRSLNILTIKPESGETIDLKFTVYNGVPDAKAEQELFALVNEERRKAGLGALTWSNALRDVGRKHSDDMFRRSYFAHINPDGLAPSDRADKAGVTYFIIGENLALAPTVPTAHRGLMDSPGHRANILEKRFGKLGIGVIDGGVYGKMFTQTFTD